MTFNELNIAEPILKAVCEKGYNEPTPIQEQAIPVVLRGKDIFGIAQTGTGKTAAFAIPILQMLSEDSARDERSSVIEPGASRRDRRGRSHGKKECRAIRSLILTPTRELALQIGDCFTDYGKYTGLKHTAIFGGVKQNPQTEKLRQGVDILIATPGRLLDLIAQGEVKLDALTHFVLDEADRMLDMGFIADIRRLLKVLPAKRQTLFFSATMPKDIVALSGSILHDPVRVEVTPVSSTVDTVDQCVYFVEKPEKKRPADIGAEKRVRPIGTGIFADETRRGQHLAHPEESRHPERSDPRKQIPRTATTGPERLQIGKNQSHGGHRHRCAGHRHP